MNQRSLLWFLKQLNRIENVSLMHLMLKHSHKQSVIILSEFLQKVYGIELATQRSMHSYRQFRREIVCIAAKVNCSNITSWWLSHRSNRLGVSLYFLFVLFFFPLSLEISNFFFAAVDTNLS